MKVWLKASMHLPKRHFFKTLKKKLKGNYNNYYIHGNARSVWANYRLALGYAKKWLNRRSQRKSYTWKKFERLLECIGVPYQDRRKRSVYISAR